MKGDPLSAWDCDVSYCQVRDMYVYQSVRKGSMGILESVHFRRTVMSGDCSDYVYHDAFQVSFRHLFTLDLLIFEREIFEGKFRECLTRLKIRWEIDWCNL